MNCCPYVRLGLRAWRFRRPTGPAWIVPMFRAGLLRLACLVVCAWAALPCALLAQPTIDPTLVEFSPSPDHDAAGTGGSPLVQEYRLALYLAGQASAVQTVSLGKPAVDPDGTIRVPFVPLLSPALTPGTTYEARIVTAGPGGSVPSGVSNQFRWQAPCATSVAPSSVSAAAAGGSASLAVSAPSGCAWTTASGATWITITAGASGTGAGTVSVSIAPNTIQASRTSTVVIDGQTVTVTQAAAVCSPAVSPLSRTVTAAGGTTTTSVTAGAACPWSATSGTAWLTVTAGATGTGNGTVTISAPANTTASARTGTVSVAGQAVTVTQAAACSYALGPATRSTDGKATTGSVTVTTAAGCAWTAVSSAAWLTITSSQASPGVIQYSVARNLTGATRTATLTAGGAAFTLTQRAIAPPAPPTGVRISGPD